MSEVHDLAAVGLVNLASAVLAARELCNEWDRLDREGHSEDAIYGACAEQLRTALSTYPVQRTTVRVKPSRDPEVEAMLADPEAYFRGVRERANEAIRGRHRKSGQ